MADNFDEINEAAKKLIDHMSKKEAAAKKPAKAPKEAPKPKGAAPAKKPSIKTEVTNEMMGPDEALMKDVEKVAAPKKKAPSALGASPDPEQPPAKPKAVKKSASPKGKSGAQPAVEAAENVNPARHAQLLEEFGASGSKIPEIKGIPEPTMGSMYRDMSDAGGKAMKIAAELEPGAAERAAMARIKPSIADKLASGAAKIGIGKITPKSAALAGLAGTGVGLGINAILEGLDAEEAGDATNPIENRPALTRKQGLEAMRLADKAINRQAIQAAKRGEIHPPSRHEELYRGRYAKPVDGVEPTDQSELEAEFIKQLKRNPEF